MIEERKLKEAEHYDQKAIELLKAVGEENIQQDVFFLTSYKFLQEYLKDKCCDKKILDYGCGNGIHYPWLVRFGGEVIGIDLSRKSLQLAEKIAEKEGISNKTKFILMDCEKLEFPDNYFDIVFDGGTFSSLDLNKAYPELARVLKPNGFLVGIETFGYNPLINLKRKLNRATGKRTGWAASHIFNNNEISKAEIYFDKTEIFYFHVISWIAFPFLNLPGGIYFLKALEALDRIILGLSFLRKYSFKVVLIFSSPKK
jgi:SAM-dependent methyltransferase